ncbi:hypothetical protein CPHO_09575 [Corynebacterium phocae]|uniref:DUF4259 domain-containing protein n=1 Tax=Corynebacterium phocae TaxID=161895 RepID=A0A1L7D4Q2_9CORY|nr:DUF4259 domain-containing protein [Corynebacterium phocae]APT93095.1 hypothetical protein CPHO_09575 [Corynebacterium phocae]KAA8722398.1 hypothetical protein F4V58_09050 [Corynebacterium phocae]
MSTWDYEVFTAEANTEFLDDLARLDEDDIVEAVTDAVMLSASGDATADEEENGLAAATIAAIWAGAPFTAGEIVEDYPFIRGLRGAGGEHLNEQALALLEQVDSDHDLEPFTEALS